jgi:hypothetical protein
MKDRSRIFILATIFLFLNNLVSGQTKTITGRIIDDRLEPVIEAHIQSTDTLLLGKTDMEGYFKIEVPSNSTTLSVTALSYEGMNIKLNADCALLEIVMAMRSTYHYISSRKVDRLRLKEFNKLPEVHLQAYDKGLFKNKAICYSATFEPIKPSLDAISKQIDITLKEVKSTFEKLKVGDTVSIPFSTANGRDKTNRYTLINYSYIVGDGNFDCVIKGIITGKNRKRGYNLIWRVVNCDACKSPAVFNGKEMKEGEVLTYNMGYFKILKK